MPLNFPDRGNWKQLILFAIQWALMFIGAEALFTRRFEWGWVFVGLLSGALVGIVPHFRRGQAGRADSSP